MTKERWLDGRNQTEKAEMRNDKTERTLVSTFKSCDLQAFVDSAFLPSDLEFLPCCLTDFLPCVIRSRAAAD